MIIRAIRRVLVLRRAVILSLLVLPCAAMSQVHSLTLGIDVNSPYGLSEAWFTIRNALLRSGELETVAERPDVKTGTARVTPRSGKFLDPAKLEKAIADSGAGAKLRSMEVTAEGELIRTKDKFQLRLPEKEVLLRGLKEPGGYDRKQRWRVTGPLQWKPELLIEVRTFERVKTKS